MRRIGTNGCGECFANARDHANTAEVGGGGSVEDGRGGQDRPHTLNQRWLDSRNNNEKRQETGTRRVQG